MPATLTQYRASASEQARTADLIDLLPKGRHTVLDIGARDGHFSEILTEHFAHVTALDLEKPAFEFDRVETVQGDATRLNYPDDWFDCVFCAEVLEHIPDVERAAAEIMRVAKYEIIIGVPFEQDTRVGRTTCQSCTGINPPWGHVNSFDEARLSRLFPLPIVAKSFVGETKEATNTLSTWLMDLAGNPWGTYGQGEPCIHCGENLRPPSGRSPFQRACSKTAYELNRIQGLVTQPHANWLHMVLEC